MKYFIVVGEASGDLHGSNLVKELRKMDSSAKIQGWGGRLMEKAGAELLKHYAELAFMGFWEVVMNLRTILANFKLCVEQIETFKPDVVILIDYPGFNLRLAKKLKKKGFKVYYYISPQIWAWHQSRAKQIKENVDRMFVILPFEKQFYADRGVEVDFVGHPLLDAISEKEGADFFEKNQLETKPIIAILPGSRTQEIQRMLPTMLEMVRQFPKYQFIVAGLSIHGEPFYRNFIHHSNVKLVIDQTYELLNNAKIAIVTSGTATLETALFKVPQVVCYKGNWLSYLVGRTLVKVEYIAMVNLVMNKEVVPELIQSDFNADKLKTTLHRVMDDKKNAEMLEDYKELRNRLGGKGASHKTAELIVSSLTV